jgi:hypothetical protein
LILGIKQRTEEELMPAETQNTRVSKTRLWAGRIMSALVILFLAFDIVIKFVKPAPAPVMEAFARLGWSPSLAPVLGTVLLVSTALYVIPITSILGAILLTGYLGGAVATHLRVGDPLLSHVLFPTYLGVLLWGGLYLRDDRLRALIPLRTPKST